MPEAIDLTKLMPQARAFLAELARDNTRAWFADNKTRYDTELKRPAEKLLAHLARWLAAEYGQEIKTKLFRPHRDIRFAKDKTPYHTHLHMMWSLPDGRAWMLGLSPDYATAGAGVMGFEPAQLDRYRAAVDGPNGADLAQLLEQGGWRLDPPELKRVPRPYPADHPRERLLRYKGLVAWRDNLESALSDDPEKALQQAFAAQAPLIGWLDGI